MAETKWTPGPWHVDPLGKVRCAAEDGKGFIADPGDGRYAGSIPRIEAISNANAHLIAAAPELYEALADLADMVELGSLSGDEWDKLRAANHALAKARGEQ